MVNLRYFDNKVCTKKIYDIYEYTLIISNTMGHIAVVEVKKHSKYVLSKDYCVV